MKLPNSHVLIASRLRSAVPSGRAPSPVPPPKVKTLGYSQKSLRDFAKILVALGWKPALQAIAWLLPLLLCSLGCQRNNHNTWQGYIEGEYVYVSSPFAGALQTRAVQRGQEVKTGDLLFVLDPEPERAQAQEAERRWLQAKSRLENLTKGKRPTEIATLEARLSEARASLTLWEAEYARRKQLYETKVISAQEWDQAKNQRAASQAQVDALTSELETARLGGRVDEVKAAEADTEAQAAALAKARWVLDQKMQKAPRPSIVHDTLYQPGEWVPAGNPVIALLPPENLKVRFFVPEPQLPSVKPGGKVQVLMDGASAPISATISYISTQAEFTPPVIFSRETRTKLVYMIEAVFAVKDAAGLRPGQPVDVTLMPAL